MEAFNRAIVGLIAVVWCVAFAGLLVMVWLPTRAIDIETARLSAFFTIALTPTMQIVATAILGALLLIGLYALLYQLVAPRYGHAYRSSDDMYRRLDQRISHLEGRRGDERARPLEQAPEEAPVEARHDDRPRRWAFGRRER